MTLTGRLLIGIASFFVLPGLASAQSVLNPCAHNGIELSSHLELGFMDDDGGTAFTTGTFPWTTPPSGVWTGDDFHRSAPDPNVLIVWNGLGWSSPTTPWASATIGPALAVPHPISPVGKNEAKATVRSFFEFGFPTPGSTVAKDTFILGAVGNASAVTALTDIASKPAKAVIDATARALFYNNPTPTCSGNFKIPAVSPTLPNEIIQLKVTYDLGAGPIIVADLNAPWPATLVPLVAGNRAYEISYRYHLEVPHGTDPPFNSGVEITVEPASATPTRTLTMSGEWFQNRGQLVDIPINGGVVYCGFGGVGEPIGIGGCLGNKPGTNATGMAVGQVMFKAAGGGVPGAAAAANVNGGAPASFTVAPHVFAQNNGQQVVALPINLTVQQLATTMIFRAPGTSMSSGLSSMNWQAKFSANAHSNDPGQSARLAKSFRWCPGVGGPGCAGPGAATGVVAGYNGLIEYKNANPNAFGGTMAMMSASGGYVSLALDKASFGMPTGLSLAMAHQQFGSPANTTIFRPQWMGLGYAATRTNAFPGAPIYNSFSINTPCAANVLPPSPAGCSHILGQGPQIVFPTIPTPGGGTIMNFPLSIPGDSNINFGFPWTTGTVTAIHTGITAKGAASSETLSAMGYDNRTPAGNGRIVMVSGGVSHRMSSGKNFTAIDAVRMDFTSPVPAMSAPAIGAVVTLMLLAGGYMARRTFAGSQS